MSQILFEIQTDSDNPGEYRVVGARSGRVYGTFPTITEASHEVERREAAIRLRKLIRQQVSEAIEDGDTDGRGWCVACGAEHFEVEPDARGYVCDECGAPKVYGIEEIALAIG